MDQKKFSKGFFAVTGSNLIRIGDVYKVNIFSFGYEKEEEILIRIKHNKNDTNGTDFEKVKLYGNQVQTIDIDVSGLPEDDYVLQVKKNDGEKFEAIGALHMNTKMHSVFIQTDKSMYKPGDNIQFRVIVVDAQTKPLNDAKVEIFITDGAENRIKQFDGPKFNKGVFQNELQLSDFPVMGVWGIHVKVNDGEDNVKEFDVAEYVLPKFEVTIDSNPDITFKDGKIVATVKANYTFGKIAKGNATVMAEVLDHYAHRHFGWNHQPSIGDDSSKVTKTVEVDGKKFVEFDLANELKITDDSYERTIKLTASFKEELSGKEAKASTEVKIHTTPHKIELKKSSEKFKPGLPFSITAILKFHDKNAPVSDAENPVKYTVTYYWDILRKHKQPDSTIVAGRRIKPNEEYEVWETQFKTEDHEIFPKNGFATLDINLEKNITHFDVKAKYLDTEESIHNVEKHETESNQYIIARVLNENPLLSENVSVEVLTTEDISQVSYQVIGRGNSIEAKSMFFESTKKYILEIKPTLMMVPKAQLIVYYLTHDGEIISDKTEIEFGCELLNNIDIQLSTLETKPRSNIDICVTTQSNSFVGLLGVDQSVMLLKKGNDIEPSMVFSELEKYGSESRYNYYYYSQQRDDIDFRDAIIITNAKKPFSRHVNIHTNMAFSCKGTVGFGAPNMKMARAAPMAMRAGVMDDEMCFESIVFADATAPINLPEIKKPVEIRTEFPETWLFDNLEFNEDLKKILTKKVPDTITSWIITGFSINFENGLGVTKKPSKFNVFQPFFVSTNLPYSIKQGEVVAIPVTIFNYMDSEQDATVTLYNKDGEFEFVEENSEKTQRTKSISIKANEGANVSFMIKALKVGNITIKIVAESAIAGDGVERQLRVEPLGVTQFNNDAVFIDLRNKTEFSTIFDLKIPENVVADSTHIEIGAIGDILGPTLNNLDKLIQMPCGCGEQNMLNFVPNIVILDYLTNVKQLTPAIEAKAKKYMEIGYQRELSYKHNDGSYSAFGKSDHSGSTWLTAFVAKSFNQASKFILIDDSIIKQALNFLKKIQSKDGSFPEVGSICHKDMQGGSSKGIALTAYTLITFVENEKYRNSYKETIDKALNYIIENSNELDDNYSLAIASYALQLAKHKNKDSILKELDRNVEGKDGLKYWTKEMIKSDNDCWHHRPNSVNVEMTAYALQAYIESGKDADAIPIMKWLVSQRNENGGFQSTQDTVVGLQALSKLASKIYEANSEVEITVKSKDSAPVIMNINKENSLILQKYEVPSTSRHFEVSAKGKGFCILQVAYRFNLEEGEKLPRFEIKPEVQEESCKEVLYLSVGIAFIADARLDKSNMAVMEVTLPSGFIFDSDCLEKILRTPKVKKVETKNGDTTVIIYFDDINTEEIRPNLTAIRTHKVAEQKPVPIVVYDYYDNSRRATAFYTPIEISVADIEKE